MTAALPPTGFPGSAMRVRVTLQQPLLSSDGAGGYTKTWEDVADLWAQMGQAMTRAASAGHETLQDQHLTPTTLWRFTLRYYAGITADMRLSYEGRVFNIRSVSSPNERKALTMILAEEGTAA